ncbi:MAG: hypothetical protein KDJ72_08420 [Methyloceanibacter sp.]|uniref:hypothetical protein n=1 Tax=Methyloceanibacter sp. TaxID=1965321 RepID=UPI001DE7B4CC|nr:hypothetical protein [Methyloceanibacter sp.]MCB1443034.1 hypothetical protein [Methyloceanibacter sp.]
MPVPMPTAVVLIVCKTVVAGPADQNAAYTGYENRQWATEHSMMVCRRQEVQLYDQAEAMGAAAQPFNQQRCQRAGISLGVNWDQAHRGSSYRFWRIACPVPIVDTKTGDIIAWKMPECGRRDIVVCEVDTAI